MKFLRHYNDEGGGAAPDAAPETTPDITSEPEPTPDNGESLSIGDFWDKAEADILSFLNEEENPAPDPEPAPEPEPEPPVNQEPQPETQPPVELPDDLPDVFKIDAIPVEKPVEKPVEPPQVNPQDALTEQQKIDMTPEELEAFNEKFFENPYQAVTEIAQRMAKDMVSQREQEIMQQTEQTKAENQKWDNITKNFMDTHKDYGKYKDKMLEFIKDDAYGLKGDERGLEKAYALAKASAIDNVPGVDDMLQSEEVLEKIYNDEAIKSRIINEYLKSVNSGESPKIITGEKGKPPSAPKAKSPQTLDEAEEAFLKSIGL